MSEIADTVIAAVLTIAWDRGTQLLDNGTEVPDKCTKYSCTCPELWAWRAHFADKRTIVAYKCTKVLAHNTQYSYGCTSVL